MEKIAQKRAAKTAHALALQEAAKEDPRFTFLELYMVFFKRIYEHEYKRNHTVELERLTYRIRMDPTSTLCEYHGEFDDDFVKRIHRKVEKEYARSKWLSISSW